MADASARHIRACEGFSGVVMRADGGWECPSPCSDWDARGVVEHVIGFHDVLLLKPLDAKPQRPKGDPVARWTVTLDAIASALQSLDEDRARAVMDASGIDLDRLLPMLTTEVLVHTWDLARALGVDAVLDPGLSVTAYQAARPNEERLQSAGVYAPPVPVPDDADVETKLVAFLGRDPSWTAP